MQMDAGKRTLIELIAGIVFASILFQALIVWFVEDKAGFSLGLWIGAATAVLYAWHMWRTLDTALDLPADAATKVIRLKSLLRYGIVILVMFIASVISFINPLAVFLGIMSLKVAAYFQPFTHRIIKQMRR